MASQQAGRITSRVRQSLRSWPALLEAAIWWVWHEPWQCTFLSTKSGDPAGFQSPPGWTLLSLATEHNVISILAAVRAGARQREFSGSAGGSVRMRGICEDPWWCKASFYSSEEVKVTQGFPSLCGTLEQPNDLLKNSVTWLPPSDYMFWLVWDVACTLRVSP